MEAKWDETRGTYIAEGYFDNDLSYAPGSISVRYMQKTGDVTFVNGYDFTTEEAISSVPEEWQDATVTVHKDSEGKSDITIQTSDPNVI